MFSNISFSLVERAFGHFDNRCNQVNNLTLTKLLELVQFLFNSTYFQYKDKFYTQIKGSAIGNPASPIIAEICMEYIIENAINMLEFEPSFLYIFVDDIIMAAPIEKVDNVLMAFNSMDEYLDFTTEIEQQGCISYLDVSLLHDGRKIITKWFNKPIAPPSILNFKSAHPPTQKIGTLVSLKKTE